MAGILQRPGEELHVALLGTVGGHRFGQRRVQVDGRILGRKVGGDGRGVDDRVGTGLDRGTEHGAGAVQVRGRTVGGCSCERDLAGGVDDRVAARQGPCNCVRVGHGADRVLHGDPVGIQSRAEAFRVAHQCDHLVAALYQGGGGVGSDVPGRPCEKYSQVVFLRVPRPVRLRSSPDDLDMSPYTCKVRRTRSPGTRNGRARIAGGGTWAL